MFIELTNSSATFQIMMIHIFALLLNKHHHLGIEIIMYMGDILIASAKAQEGHCAATTDMFSQWEAF